MCLSRSTGLVHALESTYFKDKSPVYVARAIFSILPHSTSAGKEYARADKETKDILHSILCNFADNKPAKVIFLSHGKCKFVISR